MWSSVYMMEITKSLDAFSLPSIFQSLISLMRAFHIFLTCERMKILAPRQGRFSKGNGKGNPASLPPLVHSASWPNCFCSRSSFSFSCSMFTPISSIIWNEVLHTSGKESNRPDNRYGTTLPWWSYLSGRTPYEANNKLRW